MDKRRLRRIKVKKITEADWLESVSRTKKNKTSVLFSAYLDRQQDNEDILVMDLYKTSEISESVVIPSLRFFFAESDYITLDKDRWRTGSLYHTMLSRIGSNHYGYTKGIGNSVTKCGFISSQDEQAAEDFFKPFASNNMSLSLWDRITVYQNSIMDARLAKKHSDEIKKFEYQQSMVPELPGDFFAFAEEYGCRRSRVLLYKTDGKTTTGKCNPCGKTVQINRKDVKVFHDAPGICPECGRSITYLAAGKVNTGRLLYENVCILQKTTDGGLVLRFFEARILSYLYDCNYVSEFKEYKRSFFYPDNGKMEYTDYHYTDYKMTNVKRWCRPVSHREHREWSTVYTNNLSETIRDTVLRYCAVDVWQSAQPYRRIPIEQYLIKYHEHPYIEYLIKSGLYSLASHFIIHPNDSVVLNLDTSNVRELVGLSGNLFNVMVEADGGKRLYEILFEYETHGVKFDPEALKIFERRFCDNKGGHETSDNLAKVFSGTKNLKKFMSYAHKQVKSKLKEANRNFLFDWYDYIDWSIILDYDMNDEYVVFPPDFKKAHDRVMAEHEKHLDSVDEKANKKLYAKVEKVLGKYISLASGIEFNGLTVVVPKCAMDIKIEGRVLHHCISNYIEKIALGKSLIFFVRRTVAQDVPFYTMEFVRDRSVQCRGSYNKFMTPEVEAFVKVFQREFKKRQQEAVKIKEKKAV